MIACGLVWKRIEVKMHEGAAILHPRLNRIEARSPSYQATAMQQRTMSYPLVALCYLIFHPQRTSWRLNKKRGPCTVPAISSVACITEYEEKSVERDDSWSRPPKMCPRGIGAQHHHFRSCILPSGLHPPRTCLHLPLSGDLKT